MLRRPSKDSALGTVMKLEATFTVHHAPHNEALHEPI